jgi:hypothetical protein
MSEHDLDRKADRALVAVVLSTATLITCFGMLVFR